MKNQLFPNSIAFDLASMAQMVSPKSGLSSLYCNSSSPWARRAIQCRRTLPAKCKCSQTASVFYLPTASWEHSWTHAKELASGLLQAWMWSLDSKLIKIDEHRWEMIDVWERGDIRNTMDTLWRWWERNTVEKIAHVPFLGTTKFHSLLSPVTPRQRAVLHIHCAYARLREEQWAGGF